MCESTVGIERPTVADGFDRLRETTELSKKRIGYCLSSEFVARYVVGDCSEAEQRAAKEHLGRCGRCRESVESARSSATASTNSDSLDSHSGDENANRQHKPAKKRQLPAEFSPEAPLPRFVPRFPARLQILRLKVIIFSRNYRGAAKRWFTRPFTRLRK